jgi:hypothetical protein
MDRSSLIVVVIPIVIPIALFTGMVLPIVAASRSGRSHVGGRPTSADARERTGAAGRKARQQKPGANAAAPAGYLYVPCVRNPHSGYSAGTRRWVQEVPIVKKTARLIYYTSDSWDPREAVVSPGCISREQFETDTRCRETCRRDIAGLVCAPHGRGHRHCVHVLSPGRHCHAPGGCGDDCPADTRGWRCAQHGYTWEHCLHGEDRCRHGYPAGVIPVPGHRDRPGPVGRLFFATRQAAEDHLHRRESERAQQAVPQVPLIRAQQSVPQVPLIKELRRAMADAHPDRGGTAEQFIQAHRRYQTVLRAARG